MEFFAQRTSTNFPEKKLPKYNPSCIVISPSSSDRFDEEVTLSTIKSMPLFRGFKTEGAHAHMSSFEYKSISIAPPLWSLEDFRLKLFPFTLEGDAQRWIHSLPPNSVHTWTELTHQFYVEFDEESKKARTRRCIRDCKQDIGEQYGDYLRRFIGIVKGLDHDMTTRELTSTFYDSLRVREQMYMDSMTADGFLELADEERVEQIMCGGILADDTESKWCSWSRSIQGSHNRASEQWDTSSTARSLRTRSVTMNKHAKRSQTSSKEDTFEDLREAIKELRSDNASMRGLINKLAKDMNKVKTEIGPSLFVDSESDQDAHMDDDSDYDDSDDVIILSSSSTSK